MTQRNKLFVSVGAGLVLFAGLVGYEVILPNSYASSYNKNLAVASTGLHASLVKVADSTTRPIFTNPDSTSASDKNDLVIIKEATKDADTKLQAYKTTAGSLKKLPLTGYFGSYKQAKATSQKAANISNDVTKRLGSYEEVVTFSDKMNGLNIKMEDQSNDLEKKLNSSEDPTVTATAIDQFVSQMRNETKEMQAINAPQMFKDLQKRNSDLDNKMLDAFDQLSVATKKLDLDGIDAAGNKLDDLSNQSDKLDKELQTIISQDSTFIKSVKELPGMTTGLKL